MKQVLLNNEYYSSVSPKGQITLPAALRMRLGIKAKDQVSIRLDEKGIIVKRLPQVSEFFMSIPALKVPMGIEKMTEIVAEEMAEEFKRQGV